jgi:ParB/RepB/Spo0J family partition protein
MAELKKSISDVGILVPLTVYENTREFPKTKYILLDGERRLRVAKELNMATVPANVIEEPRDITQNIMFMFNIHHYRKEWELFPTALKLEVIIKALKTDNESQLSSFTGVSRSMIRRCKILLWYPPKYRDTLMDRTGKVSTDFFIELYPIAFRLSQEAEFDYPLGLEKLVDGLINVFQDGKVIVDVKEFREIRRAMGYYEDAGNFNAFKEKMVTFLSRPQETLDIFVSPELEANQARRNIIRNVSYLIANLSAIEPDMISDLTTVEQLRKLSDVLENILIKLE